MYVLLLKRNHHQPDPSKNVARTDKGGGFYDTLGAEVPKSVLATFIEGSGSVLVWWFLFSGNFSVPSAGAHF